MMTRALQIVYTLRKMAIQLLDYTGLGTMISFLMLIYSTRIIQVNVLIFQLLSRKQEY